MGYYIRLESFKTNREEVLARDTALVVVVLTETPRVGALSLTILEAEQGGVVTLGGG